RSRRGQIRFAVRHSWNAGRGQSEPLSRDGNREKNSESNHAHRCHHTPQRSQVSSSRRWCMLNPIMGDHHHHHSRRDFFRRSFGGVLAGAGVCEEVFVGGGWAGAKAPTASANLFDIEKVGEGVFAALANPAALTNSNAAIFVLSKDVLVVDAHSKPSAAAALIAQIKKEVTDRPVRYLVNTHFHWDHTQGDAAYKRTNPGVQIIASETTKQLMSQ